MSSPKVRSLVLPLLALVIAAPMPATLASAKPKAKAAIQVPCSTDDGAAWQYLTKPKACPVYDASTDATYVFTPSALKWKQWGDSAAKGSGTLKTKIYDGDVAVKASGLKRCSATVSIYTRVVVSVPNAGWIAKFTGLPCPT